MQPVPDFVELRVRDRRVHGTQTPEDAAAESRTRLLTLLNLYRLLCAMLTLFIASLAENGWFSLYNSELYYLLCPLYLAYAGVAFILTGRVTWVRITWGAARLSLLLFVGDVGFLVGYIYCSGGTSSGIGMLLFPWLAGYGWLLRNRRAFVHAALAALAVLGLEIFWWTRFGSSVAQFLPAGLLGVGYFATTGLGMLMGRYATATEAMAVQRGVDLANLAQVNQQVIQDMLDGVVVVDGTTTVRAFNTQAARFLGNFGQKTTGVQLTEFALPLSDYWQAWVNHTTEVPGPLAIGGRLLRVRFVPVGAHRVDGALIYLEDLGRAQSQAQQLKLAALGRLTANIAHEIRNPLSAVNHATELLLEETALPQSTKKLLGIVHTNAGRIDRIVSEVLELNRRDRRQAETFQLEPAVRALVHEIIEAERIPEPCVGFHFSGDASVRFDRGHFGQIVWNLVRNAWQHCRKLPGSIKISGRPGYSPFHVLLEIVDDGAGVPEAVRPQLFEPFFTTRAGGTGLGLYVARQLCEANGATLDLVATEAGGHFRLLALSNVDT